MSRRVRTVSADATLAELERILLEERVGGVPVVRDGRVVGVVSRSDIVKQSAVGQAIGEHLVFDYYTAISGFGRLPETTAMADVARIAADHLAGRRVRDVMVERVVAVTPDSPLAVVARAMVTEGIHRVLVISGDTLVGVVTSLDLVSVIAAMPVATPAPPENAG